MLKDKVQIASSIKSRLDSFVKEQHALKNCGYKLENSKVGAIKNAKEHLKNIQQRLPIGVNLNSLIKIYRKMSVEELNNHNANEDEINAYLDELKLKSKQPPIGQRFRFNSYLPYACEVVKIENNLVYYKIEGKDFEKTYPLKYFIEEKEKNKLYYVG